MKKIIFLINPQEERKIIYKINCGDYDVNKELGIGDYLVDLDDDIALGKGYKETIKNIPKELNEWYLTAIPSVLNEKDKKGRALWYDYDKKEWQIYFIDNGKLKNIVEYTKQTLEEQIRWQIDKNG